jgi:signal transduction histidine kinase
MVRSRFAIIAAGLAGGSVAVWLSLGSAHDDNAVRTAVLTLVVSWSFLGAGLVALAREPRFGALLCAVGLAVYLAPLGDADAALPYTIGLVVASLWIGILVHAIAAYPSGRLASRTALATVVAAYVIVTLGQVAVVLFDDLRAGCASCPRNLLLITNDPSVAAVLLIVVSIAGALIAIAVVAQLALRWRGASLPLRRVLQPVLWTGAAGVAAVALLYATYVVAPGLSEAASWLTLALLVAFPFAFLAGLLRMRLARSAIGPLLVELGEAPSELELRDALRRALRDPGVKIVYRRDDGFVDGAGQPVALPEGASMIGPAAALIHDPSLSLDPALLRSVAAAAGLALDNARLQAALRAAQTNERRRLERDLHDGAQQRLVGLGLELALAEARAERDPPGTRKLLSRARGELLLAMNELREIARGLHPAVLTDRGIAAALEALAARVPLPVTLDLCITRLPQPIEVAAYYVAAEALTNVVKHARAESALVRLSRREGLAIVEVADDGAGGADATLGSGLRGLQDRVQAVNGRLHICSPPGGATRIRATLPVAVRRDANVPAPW